MKVVPVVAAALIATNALAATFTGSLSYSPPGPATSSDDLFVGGGKWPNYAISISWTVTDTDNSQPGFPWLYTYTFGHDGSQAAISHLIIETSPSFTSSDMTGLTGASLASLGSQTVNSGNPPMPEDMYGLRFNPLGSQAFSMTWSFYSTRAPVWGDFFARDGGGANLDNAYNYNLTGSTATGFLDPNNNNTILDDVDPLDSPADGTAANHYFYHILRPDTTLSVPEPGAVSFLALGGLLLTVRRWKR